VLTIYCWLLRLYPGSYRHDFGEEMTSVFRDACCALPPALAAKISFYGANFVDSYRVPYVRTLTVCSALPFHFGGSICNLSFVFPAPPCS